MGTPRTEDLSSIISIYCACSGSPHAGVAFLIDVSIGRILDSYRNDYSGEAFMLIRSADDSTSLPVCCGVSSCSRSPAVAINMALA